MLTEHVLLSMVRHDPFQKLLVKYGTDVAKLDIELEAYLDSLVNLIKHGDIQPKKTNALERVFNRALTQVLFTGRRSVTTVDLYLAMMSESNSHSQYFLLKYGIKKAEFVDFYQKHYKQSDVKLNNQQATEVLEEHCENVG